ncbi:hypothetical protein N825_25290 [Skermanella stibiiresistens SB22]|uniref:Uncharacterized protein n=1 Tax=Skermanella stibiiresistens SB22 TaxID=1385369 RepID=W9GVU4_9PROT|nr:hypothetical protein N825_25290 [Skermanella stibiiresistens SB22]
MTLGEKYSYEIVRDLNNQITIFDILFRRMILRILLAQLLVPHTVIYTYLYTVR